MTRGKAYRYGSVLLLVCGAVMLFLAQSAYWVNHTVFNQANFTRTTTTALLSQSSRDAIAATVVDKAFNDRLLAQRAIGDRATSLVSGLLDSDFSNQAISTLTAKTYAYATAGHRQDIAIDLTSVKAPLSTLISVAQDRGVTVPASQLQLPDQIVLVQAKTFPDLSGAVTLMLWIGPLLWLVALVLFGLYVYIGRAAYARRVYMVGLVVIMVAIFGLLTKPFIPPPVAAAIPNIDLRPVVQNVAAAFLTPFASQMKYMLGGTLLALLIFGQRYNLLFLLRSVEKKLPGQPFKKTPK